MRTRLSVFCFTITLILLSACSPPEVDKTSVAKPYDIAVIDNMEVTSFREVDGQLKKVEQKTLSKKDVMLNDMDFFDDGDFIYGTTSRDSNDYFRRAFLYELDKKRLEFSRLKKSKGSTAYNAVFDGDYYYTTFQPMDGVEFYKHDKDFNVVLEKKIPIKAHGENLILSEGKFYLLAEIQKEDYMEGKWYIEVWILSKDFELEERIPIDYDGVYTRNVGDLVKIGNMIYITEVEVGQYADNSERGGRQLLTYNLDTKEVGAIELQEEYPEFFHLDEENQILQVSHLSHYIQPYTYTFIDLKTGEQRLFRLTEEESRAEFADMGWYFSLRHKDDYYFLSDTKLVKYHYPTETKTTYDLSEFGIKTADFLILN